MPGRRASTRQRRRQASEEQIEEEEASQPSQAEDVEDDDEDRQPTASTVVQTARSKKSLRTKKVKRKGKRSTQTDEDEQGEANEMEAEAEDATMQIDIDNFHDQPLPKDAREKLVLLAKDWQSVREMVDTQATRLVIEVATAMAEAAEAKDGELAKRELEKIDTQMRNLVDTNSEMKAYQKALEDIANDLARDEDIDNVVQRFELGAEDMIEAWGNKTSRQKYAKDPSYTQFKQSIYEVQYPEQGMPPMTEFIPPEDGDISDDDDIEVGGVSQVYTCPLTLTIIEKPVSSQLCKHSFSKAAIEDYFGRNRTVRKKCPATGCNKFLSLGDLQPNAALENKVQQHLRRERRRQAEAEGAQDDDDEVIE